MAIFFVGANPGCTISTQVCYVNVGASPGCTISTQVHYIFSVQERGTNIATHKLNMLIFKVENKVFLLKALYYLII